MQADLQQHISDGRLACESAAQRSPDRCRAERIVWGL
jgi:hypothetical protein